MPFILCATICCCLPCIISVLGIREDFSQNRGATAESINALPIYKFKLKSNENGDDHDVNAAKDEGGILAAGTEKERVISGEDAVSFIGGYMFSKLFSNSICLESLHSTKRRKSKKGIDISIEPEYTSKS